MAKRYKSIEVVAAINQEYLELQGSEVIDDKCDTIGEAKRRAKYYLTEEYRNASEASTRLTYSQVLVDGVCLYDYFASDKAVR